MATTDMERRRSGVRGTGGFRKKAMTLARMYAGTSHNVGGDEILKFEQPVKTKKKRLM